MVRFDDLEKIFNEFRKSGIEETPFGIMAKTKGGYLALNRTRDGGSLILLTSRPSTYLDHTFWAVRAAVGNYDSAFAVSRDLFKCSDVVKNTAIELQRRFESFK